MMRLTCALLLRFFCLVLVAAADAGDDILKILMKGWRGHGATTNRDVEGKNVAVLSYYFLQCESKAYFFIAAADHRYEDSSSGPLADGAFKLGDNPPVKWSCETLDGKKGVVKIENRQYKLEEGAAFWILRKADKLHVFQSKVETGSLNKASQSGSPFDLLKAAAKGEKILAEYAKAIKLKLD